ncbi:MAG: pyridoxal phosphate-dependent aminotransferase [Candidatus Geothermincolia bacterium]
MISERSLKIPPFIVMDIMERAFQLERAGRDIVHMEVGEPDFDTPEVIKQAALAALAEGKTHYTHSLGIPELRQAVADHYRDRYGASVEPERVIITNGTSPALMMIFAALLDTGDGVITSNPGYACYSNIIEFMDGVPQEVPVYEEDGFSYRPADISDQITPRTKAILINSPSNPTGNLLAPEVMREITELSSGRLYVVSDEIYHGLVYEAMEHSILEFTDRAFVINGFSKLYAMTGWRLGYIIAPPDFVRPLQKIQQNLFISANSFVQCAGVAALTQADEAVRRMVRTYNERRHYILPRIREAGFTVAVEPHGAFYVLANARRFTDDSLAFALELLEHAGVAVAPGIDFGTGAEGYIRFSYATALPNIERGMDRLRDYLSTRAARD